jgi:hypothetical protein
MDVGPAGLFKGELGANKNFWGTLKVVQVGVLLINDVCAPIYIYMYI